MAPDGWIPTRLIPEGTGFALDWADPGLTLDGLHRALQADQLWPERPYGPRLVMGRTVMPSGRS